MSIYVIVTCESKRFVEATRSFDYAKRLVERLNECKCLTKDGSRYEYIEIVDLI